MVSTRERGRGPSIGRPGGRTARVRGAVQAAALAELLEKGFAGLSHRRIAARAGVDPTTVYRRWPTRSRLVADLLLDLANEHVAVPDTGRLADDLAAYLRQVVSALAEPQPRRLAQALSSVASEGDHEAIAALREFWAHRFASASLMLDRAVARGEVAAHQDPHTIIESLVAPAWFRALASQAPSDEAFIARCVAAALAQTSV